MGAAGGLGGRVGGGSGLPREKTVTGTGLGPQDFEVPILVTPASEMVTTFVGDDMALALELAKAAAAAEAARVRAGRGPKQLAEAPTAEKEDLVRALVGLSDFGCDCVSPMQMHVMPGVPMSQQDWRGSFPWVQYECTGGSRCLMAGTLSDGHRAAQGLPLLPLQDEAGVMVGAADRGRVHGLLLQQGQLDRPQWGVNGECLPPSLQLRAVDTELLAGPMGAARVQSVWRPARLDTVGRKEARWRNGENRCSLTAKIGAGLAAGTGTPAANGQRQVAWAARRLEHRFAFQERQVQERDEGRRQVRNRQNEVNQQESGRSCRVKQAARLPTAGCSGQLSGSERGQVLLGRQQQLDSSGGRHGRLNELADEQAGEVMAEHAQDQQQRQDSQQRLGGRGDEDERRVGRMHQIEGLQDQGCHHIEGVAAGLTVRELAQNHTGGVTVVGQDLNGEKALNSMCD